MSSKRLPLWFFPALAFAVLVNALLFLLLPLLTQKGSALPDMTEPIPVNLVRLPEQEPPVPEHQEPRPREPEPAEEMEELFEPDLVIPEAPEVEMEAIPLPVEIHPRLMSGPSLALKKVYEAGELDHPPRPLAKMPPMYPYTAKRLGIEGYVKVKFLVDEDGAVRQVSILESSPQGVFDDTVLESLPSWRFSPGTILGEPVASWVVTTIRFELR